MKKIVKLLTALFIGASLVACSSSKTASSSSEAIYNAGTYTGVGAGRNGELTVEVVVTDSKIESVTVTAHTETAGIADPAIEKVPAQIVEKQSTEVDAVSGATITKDAIVEAVNKALEQAKK